MRKRVSLVDGDGVAHTVTRVNDDTRSTARGIKRQNSLNSNVEGRDVEGFEEDLGHALSVSLRVQRGFSKKGGVFSRIDAQLGVVSVVPDLLHVIPVSDDTVLEGVLDDQNSTSGHGGVTDIVVLLAGTNHDALLLRNTDDSGKDGFRGVFAGNAALAAARSIVNNDGSLRHLGFLCSELLLDEPRISVVRQCLPAWLRITKQS
mmetsp:Transcript_14328/g.35454  ORF Transcript_14328/g.35454 Transcript_14328/m.35454 type:complete len:204 (+) Transcript_14328:255-866(+)